MGILSSIVDLLTFSKDEDKSKNLCPNEKCNNRDVCTSDTRSLNILLVDDNPDSRDLIVMVSRKYALCEVNIRCKAGWRDFNGDDPNKWDFIISDLCFNGDVPGERLLENLKGKTAKRQFNKHLIFISGHAERITKIGEDDRVLAAFEKPLDFFELIDFCYRVKYCYRKDLIENAKNKVARYNFGFEPRPTHALGLE